MIYVFLFLYTIIYVFLFIPIFCIGALFNAKMREGLIERIKQPKKIKKFAQENTGKTIVFFHSSSVGEWEQSIPIIKSLKQMDAQLVAESVAASLEYPEYHETRGTLWERAGTTP